MPTQVSGLERTAFLKALLAGDDAYATTLVVLAVDAWGTECLQWHPAALRAEFEETYGTISQDALDKLMAGIAVLTTDQFWADPARFVQLANVLAGSGLSDTFDPADSVECAWAVTEALLLDPPDAGTDPFSDDVRAYIGFVLKEEGFVTPPDVLRIALDADFSAQVTYDFTDDPALFEGIYANQRGKTADVEAVVRENLIELVGQLRMLPLRNGDTRELEERIKQLEGQTDGE